MLGVTLRVEKIDLADGDSIVAVCRRGQHRQTVLDLPMPRVPPAGAEWVEPAVAKVASPATQKYTGVPPG